MYWNRSFNFIETFFGLIETFFGLIETFFGCNPQADFELTETGFGLLKQ